MLVHIKKLIQQAKQFKAKNVVINNPKFYLKVKNSLKKTKVFSGNLSNLLNKES